ncbi:MAG: quinone-dependent dihydroorotate dehydrogenase [bacterium]
MNTYYKYRNAVIHFLYTRVLKPILFLNDPENIHDSFLFVGTLLGKFSLTRWKTRMMFGYKNLMLNQNVLGITFANPVGLSAGFDKDGVLTDIIDSVGFGFAELGSVTAKPYEGNPRPRLWRLPKSKSLGVWYGLKNKSAGVLVKKLYGKKRRLPLGVSVAFTNCKENLDIDMAIADYVAGFGVVFGIADYITVNISCPNTSGGQPFVILENYDKLMTHLDKIETKKPIFVKISPDMSKEAIDEFLRISREHKVDGIICSNLTKRFEQKDVLDPIPPHGGLSGKMVFPKAMDLLSYMYKKEPTKFVYVFCGGIFSADDAYMAIRNGATLIQMITGMIFEGPQLISEINRGLSEKLSRDGFKNVSEAIGVDNV